MDKEGSIKSLIIVMVITLAIAFLWESMPFFKNITNAILNPSAGILLNWNLIYGMLILVFIITLLTTLVQKYATDQETLKQLKKEQKELQKDMKKFKDHPEKMMQMQKEMMPLTGKMMKHSMRAMIYTAVPFVLFFKWFQDYFTAINDPKIFWIFGWFGTYLIFTILFSSLLRKWMDVA